MYNQFRFVFIDSFLSPLESKFFLHHRLRVRKNVSMRRKPLLFFSVRFLLWLDFVWFMALFRLFLRFHFINFYSIVPYWHWRRKKNAIINSGQNPKVKCFSIWEVALLNKFLCVDKYPSTLTFIGCLIILIINLHDSSIFTESLAIFAIDFFTLLCLAGEQRASTSWIYNADTQLE